MLLHTFCRQLTKYVFIMLLLSAPIYTLAASQCYVIYDAGSSGTRLHVYEKKGEQWLLHEGPKTEPLSSYIYPDKRKNKKNAGMALFNMLDELRSGNNGNNIKAFDWPTECQEMSVMVYATAGMRMKEAENPEASKALWHSARKTLQEKIQSALPASHTLKKVEARTITGYEEGAYAWLSVRLKGHKGNNDFGLLELGGASAQVVFPCQTCKESVNTICVEGQPVKLYSHSFLGLGQNLAVKSVLKHPLNQASPCFYGAGKNNATWVELSCSNDIRIESDHNIFDPYNFSKTGQQGNYCHIPLPEHLDKNFIWFLAGAFSYMQKDDIDNFCQNNKSAYMPETACFRAVYQHKLLQALGINKAPVSDSSWTFGAVVCTDTHCMDDSVKHQCSWLPGGGCLE